ncbi:hypothetical protein HAX54_046992, partial [Datura stramonium]|nr:hypothetical protein [Datura stramonium]
HSITIANTNTRQTHRAYGQVICRILGWDIKRLPSIVLSAGVKPSESSDKPVEAQNSSLANSNNGSNKTLLENEDGGGKDGLSGLSSATDTVNIGSDELSQQKQSFSNENQQENGGGSTVLENNSLNEASVSNGISQTAKENTEGASIVWFSKCSLDLWVKDNSSQIVKALKAVSEYLTTHTMLRMMMILKIMMMSQRRKRLCIVKFLCNRLRRMLHCDSTIVKNMIEGNLTVLCVVGGKKRWNKRFWDCVLMFCINCYSQHKQKAGNMAYGQRNEGDGGKSNLSGQSNAKDTVNIGSNELSPAKESFGSENQQEIVVAPQP